jgi:hypothetical protein
MLNSTTLEVAIGMALVYLLLSLFCTAVREAIAGVLGSRAKNLERGIVSLFTDASLAARDSDGVPLKDAEGKPIPSVSLATAIYDHGLVQSLYRSNKAKSLKQWWGGGTKLPSYIPSRTFSTALFDILFSGTVFTHTGSPGSTATPTAADSLQRMLTRLNDLPASKGKQAILSLVAQAEGDIEKTRKAFETWYEEGMDRAAGWYKRKTQLVLFILGVLIAVALNVDSFAVGRALWNNPALRSYTVVAAEQYAKTHNEIPAGEAASLDLSRLESLTLPIGWNGQERTWHRKKNQVDATRSTGDSASEDLGAIRESLSIYWPFAIGGWLLTALAMTVGAPFWFDLLNQFMVIRSTVKPSEKSGTESSKDAK